MSKLVIFNKPFQVLSQFSPIDQKACLADFLDKPEIKNCYPAGRLDYDSEGLLLLTDEGKLQHQITHPKHKLNKSYWVQVEGKPTLKDLAPLKKGITLKDGPCKPAKVEIISEPKIWKREPPIRHRKDDVTSWLNITISEGRNRQVRRMCGAIGFPCLRLVRHQIGTWDLKTLAPGEYTIQQVHLPQDAKPFGKSSSKHKRSSK